MIFIKLYFKIPEDREFTYLDLADPVRRDKQHFPGLVDAPMSPFSKLTREVIESIDRPVPLSRNEGQVLDFLIELNGAGNYISFEYLGEESEKGETVLEFDVTSKLLPLKNGKRLRFNDLGIKPLEFRLYGRSSDWIELYDSISIVLNALITGKKIEEIRGEDPKLIDYGGFAMQNGFFIQNIQNPFSSDIGALAESFTDAIETVYQNIAEIESASLKLFLAMQTVDAARDYLKQMQGERMDEVVLPVDLPVLLKQYEETTNLEIYQILHGIQIPHSVRNLERILNNINREEVEPVTITLE